MSPYHAEGYSPLFEVFTPKEERRFVLKLAAFAAGLVLAGLATFTLF